MRRRLRLRDQRGSVSVELVGMLPFLLLAALVVWQLLLVTYTVTSASNAARAASRVAGTGGDGRKAAVDALPAALKDDTTVTFEGERAQVRVGVPIIVPGLTIDKLRVTRSATLPGA